MTLYRQQINALKIAARAVIFRAFLYGSLPMQGHEYEFDKVFRSGAARASLHHVAVHKVLKYRTKVLTDANTPFRNYLSKSMCSLLIGSEQ